MSETAIIPLLEPTHADEVGRHLRDADAEGLAVLIQGGGTKAGWGVPPVRQDVVLSTRRLRHPIDHCAGDLTVTAAAGVTLDEVNAELAREGQWLALDPWAGGASSIGGLLATNDSGPHRHRFGAPRDLVIGVEFVLADGRRAKGGGRVVKNVAGYDMPRLLCGSFGSLAVVTAATFKLSPLAPASRTVEVDVPSWATLTTWQQLIVRSPLTPAAVEVAAPPLRLLVRFETTEAAAEQQAAALIAGLRAHGAAGRILAGDAEAEVWRAHAARVGPAGTGGTLVRVSLLPMSVAEFLAGQERAAGELGVQTTVAGRALLGALVIRAAGEHDAVVAWVSRIRTSLAGPGHAVVLEAPDAVSRQVSRWGDGGPTAALMRAVKAQFDPRHTFCPGGGPGGLT